jgi:N-methylhydantoinase A
MLGYIDPDAFLGGEMRLDRTAAERVVTELAERLGMDPIALAAGAFRIVNAHMADLIRRVSIDRGRDPRDFVLFAYGGAGPLHIAYLARELGIHEVYVPSFATVFSAMGMLTGGVLHSAERSCVISAPLGPEDVQTLNDLFVDIEGRLEALFEAEKIDRDARCYERFVHMKYRLQPGSIAVPFANGPDPERTDADLLVAFEQRYRDLYGANSGFRGAGIELVKARVEASSQTAAPRLTPSPTLGEPDPSPALKCERPIYFTEVGRHAPTPVFDGARLRPGMKLQGPAVIERMGDSIVLPTFTRASVDAFDNVVIRVDAPNV